MRGRHGPATAVRAATRAGDRVRRAAGTATSTAGDGLRRAAGATTAAVGNRLWDAPRPLAPPPPGSGLQPVPGSPGPPVIGDTLRALRDPESYGHQGWERYGRVSWSRIFGTTVVFFAGPEATEQVLVNRDKAFANGPGWSYFIGPFFRRGLMLLDFEEHLHHRRIMQPAFARKRLEGYLVGMHDVIARGYDAWEPADDFRFHPAFKQLTLDLATEVFVGHPTGPEADRLNRAFFDTVQAGTAFVRAPLPGTRWRRGLQGRRVLEEFLYAELPAKRAGDGDDLFTALCHSRDEDGNTFSDEDVVNHMIFLLMAAHDTSTTTTTTLVYELARHPDWQRRLREESQALDTDRPTTGQLAQLETLGLAVKEALRLIAPVPSLARWTVKDTEVLGHHVPAETMCAVTPYLTHRLAEYWPEPERFDPLRFSPERREDRVHPYAWFPFGGGAHKCIGMHFGTMEVTAAVHHLLRRFRWSVEPGYRMPVNLTSLPYPDDGLPIRLERLEDPAI